MIVKLKNVGINFKENPILNEIEQIIKKNSFIKPPIK